MLLQYAIADKSYKKVLSPEQSTLFIGKRICDVVELTVSENITRLKITGASTNSGFALHSSITTPGHKRIWYKQNTKANRGKKVRFYGNYITPNVSVVYAIND